MLAMVGLTLFSILYRDYLSSSIWAAGFVFPALCYAIMRVSCLRLKTNVLVDKKMLYANQPLKIQLELENKFIVPTAGCQVNVSVHYAFYDEKNYIVLNTSAFALNKQSVTYTIYPEHLGRVDVRVEEILVWDPFNLFCRHIKCASKAGFDVMPENERSHVYISDAFFNKIEESDRFSAVRGGDDPSEVFQVREYREGDKLQRVHWKLSAKLDQMMFKEGSMPIQTSAMLLLDLCYEEDNSQRKYCIDAAITALTTISTAFLREGLDHNICWYNENFATLQTRRVTTEDELFIAVSEIYSSGISKNEHHTMQSAMMEPELFRIRPIYVSPNAQSSVFEGMPAMVKERLIAIDVGVFGETDGEQYDREVRTIGIDCHHPNHGLDNLVL